ncbi:hypothetical protein V6R21_22425 [Limibacter armeniacum]|uniref:hypothetical protein n=1 Tax=Limibacter armeniacum TaxID=466084 RepID=UPI002FE5EF37
MNKIRKSYIKGWCWLIVGLLFGCSQSPDELAPSEQFVRVYQHGVKSGVEPIDFVQTADSGFLIMNRWKRELATGYGTYLMKVDNEGVTEWDLLIDEFFINPMPDIISLGGEILIAGIDTRKNVTQFLMVDVATGDVTLKKYFSSLGVPLAACSTGEDEFLIQYYDEVQKQSGIALLSSNLYIQWNKRFNVTEDGDQLVSLLNAFARGTPPFFVVNHENEVLSNMVVGSSISLIELTKTYGVVSSEIDGNPETAMVRNAYPLGDRKYAIALTNYYNSGLMPKFTIQDVDFSNTLGLLSDQFMDLDPTSSVSTCEAIINGKPYLLYATTTRSLQVKIVAFNKENGFLAGAHYLGERYGFHAVDILATDDGGLILLASTSAVDTNSSVALFKLSKKDLEDML